MTRKNINCQVEVLTKGQVNLFYNIYTYRLRCAYCVLPITWDKTQFSVTLNSNKKENWFKHGNILKGKKEEGL